MFLGNSSLFFVFIIKKRCVKHAKVHSNIGIDNVKHSYQFS